MMRDLVAGLASSVPFQQTLYDVWFAPYSRSQKYNISDSSGFEHTFVGKSMTVSQKHNNSNNSGLEQTIVEASFFESKRHLSYTQWF